MPIEDYIINPVQGNANFVNICTTSNFFVNLIYFLVYSALVVLIVYNVARGVLKITTSDEKETFLKFREALTNAVLATLGLALVASVLFIPGVVMRLIGITDADNALLNQECTASSGVGSASAPADDEGEFGIGGGGDESAAVPGDEVADGGEEFGIGGAPIDVCTFEYVEEHGWGSCNEAGGSSSDSAVVGAAGFGIGGGSIDDDPCDLWYVAAHGQSACNASRSSFGSSP